MFVIITSMTVYAKYEKFLGYNVHTCNIPIVTHCLNCVNCSRSTCHNSYERLQRILFEVLWPLKLHSVFFEGSLCHFYNSKIFQIFERGSAATMVDLSAELSEASDWLHAQKAKLKEILRRASVLSIKQQKKIA